MTHFRVIIDRVLDYSLGFILYRCCTNIIYSILLFSRKEIDLKIQ